MCVKYKNKISSFFEVSTKPSSKKTPQEAPSKKVKDEMSGLKLLLQAYSKDDGDNKSSSSSGSDSEDAPGPMIMETKSEAQAAEMKPKPSVQKPADSNDSDIDDIEIVTTSDLKSQTRNYLIPSSKSANSL